MNEIYTDAFSIYRKQFFTIEKKPDRLQNKSGLEEVEKAFDMAFDRSHFSQNGTAHTYKDIENIYTSLYTVFIQLRLISYARNHTPNECKVDNQIMMLTMIFKEYERTDLELRKTKEAKIVYLKAV